MEEKENGFKREKRRKKGQRENRSVRVFLSRFPRSMQRVETGFRLFTRKDPSVWRRASDIFTFRHSRLAETGATEPQYGPNRAVPGSKKLPWNPDFHATAKGISLGPGIRIPLARRPTYIPRRFEFQLPMRRRCRTTLVS